MISLVVSTLGRTGEIEALLKSLAEQTFKDFEVVIVDQNDDHRLAPIIDPVRWSFPVRRLHAAGQRGVSRGRNAGVEASAGDILLFPDDDCWYPPWFLAKAMQLFEIHGCASVTGRAADQTGRSINGRFETAPGWVDRKNVWTTQIEWIVFIHKDAFRAVKGYAEGIGVGGGTPWQANEGQDITLRLMKAGFRTYYDPSLYGFHAELNTTAPDEAMIGKGRIYARGLGHVLRLHDYGIDALAYWLVRPAARIGLAALKGNWAQARYYKNVALGRLEGYLGRLF